MKNCEEEVAKTEARLARLKMEAESQLPEPRVGQRSRVGSDSPSEASLRFAAENPPSSSGSGIPGGIREFAETSRQTTSVSRPSSVARTRFGSVDVRQTFGTQGCFRVRGHNIGFGVVQAALGRGRSVAKVSRAARSSHRFWCCKHGHHVRRCSTFGHRGVRVRGVSKRGALKWVYARESRYGFRGVKVGEASPRSTQTRCRRSHAAAVSQPRQHICLIRRGTIGSMFRKIGRVHEVHCAG